MGDETIDIPDHIIEIFNEYMAMWEGRLNDGFENQSYQTFFAVGYEVGIREGRMTKPVTKEDWPKSHGNC